MFNFKKGAIEWEYVAALLIAAFILFLILIYFGDIKKFLVDLIDRFFANIVG